ncbi:isoamylase [Fusarium sp. NRRL 52700]|nr:isoamylase [Fusarium sp. NRRL 52700]
MIIYSKDPDYPDAPVTDPDSPYQTGRKFYAHQPEVFNILGQINQVLAEFGDKLTVGEIGVLAYTTTALDNVSASRQRVSMGFQFETACLGFSLNHWNLAYFSLVDFKASFEKWQRFIEVNDGWTCVFMENHNIARSVSRFASDNPMYRATAAKTLATLLATSTGTLFLYQGQKIGMTNAPREWDISEYKDISASKYWKQVHDCTNGDKVALAQAMETIQSVARDHARTPVQWSDDEHAGFTDAHTAPWMRINDNHQDMNVQQQVSDPDGVLEFWHMELFIYGSWKTIDAVDQYVMTYIKRAEGYKALVMMNFTIEDQSCRDRAPPIFHNMDPVLTNMVNWRPDTLSPFGARVYIIEGDGQVSNTDHQTYRAGIHLL